MTTSTNKHIHAIIISPIPIPNRINLRRHLRALTNGARPRLQERPKMGGTAKRVTTIPPTPFVRLHPATVTIRHGGRRRRATIVLLPADGAGADADADIMIARAAVLRARVRVMSGMGIGELMKRGGADGVKVGR
jgi:hypothetical protein